MELACRRRALRKCPVGIFSEQARRRVGDASNFVYEGGNLQFLNHPEGYIEPDGSGGYDYIYQCKDHLGNIRLSFADDNGDGNIATSEIRDEIDEGDSPNTIENGHEVR